MIQFSSSGLRLEGEVQGKTRPKPQYFIRRAVLRCILESRARIGICQAASESLVVKTAVCQARFSLWCGVWTVPRDREKQRERESEPARQTETENAFEPNTDLMQSEDLINQWKFAWRYSWIATSVSSCTLVDDSGQVNHWD